MSEDIKLKSRYRKSIELSPSSYLMLEDMFDTKKQAGVFLTYVVENAIFQLYQHKDIEIKIDLLNFKY